MPRSVFETLAVVDCRSALSTGRATAFIKLRNSVKVPHSRLLRLTASAAPAQAPGMPILSHGVVDPPTRFKDDVGLFFSPFDVQFSSPMHDVVRLFLLVVVLLRPNRHYVERVFLLFDGVPLRLSLLPGDANLLLLVADTQH